MKKFFLCVVTIILLGASQNSNPLMRSYVPTFGEHVQNSARTWFPTVPLVVTWYGDYFTVDVGKMNVSPEDRKSLVQNIEKIFRYNVDTYNQTFWKGRGLTQSHFVFQGS